MSGISVSAAGFLALALAAGCVTRGPHQQERRGDPADIALVLNLWPEVNAYYAAANNNDKEQTERLHARIQPKVDAHLRVFTEVLVGGDDDEKVIAAGALGFAGSRKVIPFLIDALRSPLDQIRVNACLSLGLIADVETPVGPVVALLEDPSRVVRQTAGLTLSRILRRGHGSSMLAEADFMDWEGFCARLGREEERERKREEEQERKRRAESARLQGDAPRPAGEAAATEPAADAQGPPEPAGARILGLLSHEAQDIVRGTWRSGEIDAARKSDVVGALNSLLKRRDFLRQNLGDAKVSGEANTLLARRPRDLSGQEVVRLNRLLLEACFPEEIAAGDDPDGVLEALLKVLDDEDPLVRNNAVVALRTIAAVEAVKPLVEKGLVDRDWRVRLNTASTLGRIGDREAVGPLIQSMRDNQGNLYVMEAIKFGLREITGQDFGGSYTSWRNWWDDQKRPVPKLPGQEAEGGKAGSSGYGASPAPPAGSPDALAAPQTPASGPAPAPR